MSIIGSNIWRVDGQGEKQKLIAWVSLNVETGNLYWTHQNGYSDRDNATEAHYKAVLRHYSRRNDIIIEDRYR